MALTLIIGPMKSGKSLELIARAAPHEFANKKVLYVQPERDVRNDGITSRIGINKAAAQVKELVDVTDDADVIGIDEAHMFPVSDTVRVAEWLKAGKELIISGLDIDHSGTPTPMVKSLLELKPDITVKKLAVCETCHRYDAEFTQIIYEGKPVLKGLSPVVPEDGTYEYVPRCSGCFVRARD